MKKKIKVDIIKFLLFYINNENNYKNLLKEFKILGINQFFDEIKELNNLNLEENEFKIEFNKIFNKYKKDLY